MRRTLDLRERERLTEYIFIRRVDGSMNDTSRTYASSVPPSIWGRRKGDENEEGQASDGARFRTWPTDDDEGAKAGWSSSAVPSARRATRGRALTLTAHFCIHRRSR